LQVLHRSVESARRRGLDADLLERFDERLVDIG
jgi:hypothetical protein